MAKAKAKNISSVNLSKWNLDTVVEASGALQVVIGRAMTKEIRAILSAEGKHGAHVNFGEGKNPLNMVLEIPGLAEADAQEGPSFNFSLEEAVDDVLSWNDGALVSRVRKSLLKMVAKIDEVRPGLNCGHADGNLGVFEVFWIRTDRLNGAGDPIYAKVFKVNGLHYWVGDVVAADVVKSRRDRRTYRG